MIREGGDMKEKQHTFGTCAFERVHPERQTLSPETRVLNVILPFEEALKLNLALDEAVHRLNRYNRATRAGKASGVNVTVHLYSRRIAVNEGKVRRGSPGGGCAARDRRQ
jgi:hypothetical protein